MASTYRAEMSAPQIYPTGGMIGVLDQAKPSIFAAAIRQGDSYVRPSGNATFYFTVYRGGEVIQAERSLVAAGDDERGNSALVGGYRPGQHLSGGRRRMGSGRRADCPLPHHLFGVGRRCHRPARRQRQPQDRIFRHHQAAPDCRDDAGERRFCG